MTDQAIKTLIAQGIAAAKAGSKVAEQATAEIQNDARDPDLKSALEEGNRTSKQWKQRIDAAAKEVGGVEEIPNEILEAHYRVSKKIRQEAKDDQSRDLGIIAAGQLALHYWIAAFGTLKAYAGQVGFTQVEQNMDACVSEAKQADEAHTQIAAKIIKASA